MENFTLPLAQIRSEIRYAWRGPSALVVDNQGRATDEHHLTDYAQVENLARRAVDQYGRVDTWVTLPGTSVYGMFEEIPMEDVRQTMEVAERISPKLLDLQQLKMGFSGQKTSWPKSADAPNNLYSHVESDGGARGDFTDKAKKRSYYQEMLAAHPVASPLATGKARDKGVLVGLFALGAMGMSGKGALAATYKE